MKQKHNVILDTDISNEIDDQFALCYLIKSLDNVNLQAITIAPFKGSGYAPVKILQKELICLLIQPAKF